jgi:hypothetical protein
MRAMILVPGERLRQEICASVDDFVDSLLIGDRGLCTRGGHHVDENNDPENRDDSRGRDARCARGVWRAIRG